MKDGPKECVNCTAPTCDPCPAMAGEDGAVLGLLERLARPQMAINGAHDTYSVHYMQLDKNWVVYIYDFRRVDFMLVRAEAATLYQALLLATEALDENEATEMEVKFACTREDMEKAPIADLGYTCDIPGCNQPATYCRFGIDVCQECYETIEATAPKEEEDEFIPPTDEDWLLVGKSD